MYLWNDLWQDDDDAAEDAGADAESDTDEKAESDVDEDIHVIFPALVSLNWKYLPLFYVLPFAHDNSFLRLLVIAGRTLETDNSEQMRCFFLLAEMCCG